MHWKDWTNRKTVGVSFLIASLGMLVGLYGRPIGFAVAAFLALAGLVILVGPPLSSLLAPRSRALPIAGARRPELAPPKAGTRVRVTMQRDVEKVFLEVNNRSKVAEFWATLSLTGGYVESWPGHEVFAKWNHQKARNTKIPEAGKHQLIVGRLVTDITSFPHGAWHFPFTTDEGDGEAIARNFLYGADPGATIVASALEICVTVYADPDLIAGPIVTYLTFAGGAVESSSLPIMSAKPERR